MLESTRSQWVSLQQVLLHSGPNALRALGYEFLPIDNNPRQGVLSPIAKDTHLRNAVVEVVERCGLWWVLPTRPFRFV